MNKKLLSVAIAGAMAAPMTAQAVKYKLSGQVNRAVTFVDDGEQSDIRNVDSSASGTRFRMRGSEDLGNGMKVGMYYEVQTSSVSSSGSGGGPDADTPRNSDGIGIRQANVWFSGNWGKLTIGQQDGAGNGATEADLSGTGIVNPPGRTSYTGGMSWRTSGAGGAKTAGLTAGRTSSNFDSFSRYDALRYDTPALGPVTVSASIGNDQLWEVAGRLNTAVGGGQLSAGLFYGADTGVGNADARYGGSLAYLFAQGTNIQGWYSANETKTVAPDADSWGIKLGHKWGPNAISVMYAQASDVVAGFDDTGINVGYVRSLKKANTELYAGFFYGELDGSTAGVSYEDQTAFTVGARVKFD